MRDDEQRLCAARLQVLANPIRLKVLQRLRRRGSTVSGLLNTIEMNQNALSHHLRRLREAGLVTARRAGKSVVYELNEAVARADADAIDLGCCSLSFHAPARRRAKRASASA